MWKPVALCVSLFGVGALGLTLGARYLQPTALPLVAAIGLCIIGVVLILAAPEHEAHRPHEAERVLEVPTTLPPVLEEELELPAVAARGPVAAPFELLNS